MIRNSFVLLPRIGDKKERQLWRAGIHDWETYLDTEQVPGMARQTRRSHEPLLRKAVDAHLARDLGFLGALVPRNEHWRFYGADAPRAGFLDIETTGTARYATVTVVGVHDGATGRTHQLVQGDDLDAENLKALLSQYDLFVTFNGNGFDLPVLRHHYPHAVPDIPHLDLRGPLSRLGYKGGLKRIEVALGIARPDEVQGVSGYEAVLLWRRYRTRGDRDALGTLVDYNKEDVVNLEPLADFAVAALTDRLAPYFERPVDQPRWPGGKEATWTPELEAIYRPEAEAPEMIAATPQRRLD